MEFRRVLFRSPRMSKTMVWCLASAFMFAVLAVRADSGSTAQWPEIGNAAGGDRYSPLTAIDKYNVVRLKPKWIYHHGAFSNGETGAGATAFEVPQLGRASCREKGCAYVE